jgi:hypothetical protein
MLPFTFAFRLVPSSFCEVPDTMRKQTCLLFLLLTPFTTLPGCAGRDANLSSPKAGQEATTAQQLKAIDDNPNMPPQAKEAAKANIQQHQNMDLSLGRK